MEDLLSVIGGTRNDTLSAGELRERSLAGVGPLTGPHLSPRVHISSQSRSFVIPVLDYSPASEFNIMTLLQDLERIPGDVLVVFNNQAVADDLKGHPRITRHAAMSENIGVARAWNVGISMAATPFVMILNADLHLEAGAADALEHGLATLDRAACTGPQGSFLNFGLTRDYLYFDKGSFNTPIQVDAVSGFLFAVRRDQFGPGGLKFEEAYTPCYFEEWDLGLQIKRKGLKSWIVPATTYTHHWSGSIAARQEIDYLGVSESPQAILKRNRLLFLSKWRDLTRNEGNESILASCIERYARHYLLSMLKADNPLTEAAAHQLAALSPERADLQLLAAFVLTRLGKLEDARQYLRQGSGQLAGFSTEAYLSGLSIELLNFR